MKTQTTLNVWVLKSQKKTPIMYWTPKMHNNQVGASFIIGSKICFAKQISKSVSNIFKLVYSQIENFYKNARFLSNYNKFWALENSDPIIIQ